MAKRRRKTCPECRSKSWDGSSCGDCNYSELRCPFCDEVVSIIGNESYDYPGPCGCIVAQCGYGDDLYWECDDAAQALKKRIQDLAREKLMMEAPEELEEFEEDLGRFSPSVFEIQDLLENEGSVEVLSHDDGGPHGHSNGAWFVFLRQTKKRHSDHRPATGSTGPN